jgi:hypothetical protein
MQSTITPYNDKSKYPSTAGDAPPGCKSYCYIDLLKSLCVSVCFRLSLGRLVGVSPYFSVARMDSILKMRYFRFGEKEYIGGYGGIGESLLECSTNQIFEHGTSEYGPLTC